MKILTWWFSSMEQAYKRTSPLAQSVRQVLFFVGTVFGLAIAVVLNLSPLLVVVLIGIWLIVGALNELVENPKNKIIDRFNLVAAGCVLVLIFAALFLIVETILKIF